MIENYYKVTIGSNLDSKIDDLSEELGISKSEIIRRAIMLFIHAVRADGVKLIFKNEENMTEQNVLIK